MGSRGERGQPQESSRASGWTPSPAMPVQVSLCVGAFLPSPCPLTALLLTVPATWPHTQPRGCKQGIWNLGLGFECWPYCLLAGRI